MAPIGVVVFGVLLQGVWKPGDVAVLGEALGLERIIAIGIFLAVTLASMLITPEHAARGQWLRLGRDGRGGEAVRRHLPLHGAGAGDPEGGADGSAAALVALTSDAAGAPIPWAYFWMSGVLSSFLDNAPTYSVFFNPLAAARNT